MTCSAAALGGRSNGPVVLGAAVLLVLLVGLAFVVLSAPQAAPSPDRVPVTAVAPAAPVASVLIAAPAPDPTREAIGALPVAAAMRPDDRAPSRPADIPYRFIGKSAAGAETAIVLFGRGRVVTVRGPQALDDEYVVEAVFDDYLVVRQVSTGVGKFLALAQRRQSHGLPQDPEDAPHD